MDNDTALICVQTNGNMYYFPNTFRMLFLSLQTMLSQLSDFKTKPELGGEAEIAAEELEQLL